MFGIGVKVLDCKEDSKRKRNDLLLGTNRHNIAQKPHSNYHADVSKCKQSSIE